MSLVFMLFGSACDLSASVLGPDTVVVASGVAQVVSNGTAPAAGTGALATTQTLTATGADPVSYQLRIGQQALALVSYDWVRNLPGWTIEFKTGRAGLLGGTWPAQRRIEIYVREGQSVIEAAFTLAHELGHAVDVTRNSEEDRNEWRAARGIAADHAWWVDGGRRDFEVGAGDFAETFAVWQVGEHPGVHTQALWGTPTAAELELMARLAG